MAVGEQHGRTRDRGKVREGDFYAAWDAWLPHGRAATCTSSPGLRCHHVGTALPTVGETRGHSLTQARLRRTPPHTTTPLAAQGPPQRSYHPGPSVPQDSRPSPALPRPDPFPPPAAPRGFLSNSNGNGRPAPPPRAAARQKVLEKRRSPRMRRRAPCPHSAAAAPWGPTAGGGKGWRRGLQEGPSRRSGEAGGCLGTRGRNGPVRFPRKPAPSPLPQ